MKVVMINPQGPCNGVKYSLNNTIEKIHNAKRPIYILGSIIHNSFVANALVNKGIDYVVLESEIKDKINRIKNATAIICADGLDHNSIQTLVSNNVDIIDSTCPIVKSIQTEILEKLNQGYMVLYIGSKNHIETINSLNEDKRVILIDDVAKINDIDKDKKYFLTGQTTFNLFKKNEIKEELLKVVPNLEISKLSCNATSLRQEAVNKYTNIKNSLFIVVGDKNSSNTNKLKEILENNNPDSKVILVESINELNESYKNYEEVYITSGASTPRAITNEIKEYFEGNKKAISKLTDDDYLKL